MNKLLTIVALMALGSACDLASADSGPVRVLVWDEQQPEQKQAYDGKFLGETIAAHLATLPGIAVKSTGLDAADQGVDEAALDSTDVVIWWSHVRSTALTDEHAERVVSRVRNGKLGLIVLHSAHWAKPFVRLMQERAKADALAQVPAAERAAAKWEYTNDSPIYKGVKRDAPLTPSLSHEGGVWRLVLPQCVFPAWRADGEPSHVTTLLPQHPIAAGLPAAWDIAHTEMYDEPFHVPPPDEVVFEERWDKGEHFRSGCVWKVGNGRVFYFRPGHETFPVYKQAEPLRVIENAVRWLGAPAKYPALPSETPAKFEPATESFDFIKRDVMIPMRDEVKLHTVIVVPKGAKGAPMLLTRTPYDATELTSHAQSSHLGPILQGYDNATDVIVEGGYIRVVQDIRGKHGSEGDYVMNRPLSGPQNPTPVDHATDTYDTIDWLVKNIPESNGRVGILGISYDGFLPLMGLVNPHPALKVSVPMNPMVDGWMGDDWFHYGAFRQQNMPYIYNQQATRKSEAKWWTSHFDDYDMFMQAGSAGELGRRRGLEQVGFWRKILEHPSYDAYWRDQAVDKVLAAQPLKVPVMLVHSLWDQEDIYGAIAVYRAIEPKDTDNDKVFLVMGPWNHGQEIGQGSTMGSLKFGSDTALHFRREILRPFLDKYLKDGAPKAGVPPVAAFETGTDTWRSLRAWPDAGTEGSSIRATPLYLTAGLKLGFGAPKPADAAFDEYVSDPAKPVPFRSRPIQPTGYGDALSWSRWLVDDQREASGRPDVLAFVSDVLTAPAKISGQPIANLIASTTGTDADWVVKLIDVYPDEVAGDPGMGGYQLMVSADIFRGRYRESFENAKAIDPNVPLAYRFALPTANHVFKRGHRIMVQVQSSWFPLYDRNPQTFVPNIFWAKPGDYQKAVQRVHHSPDHASFVELPLVKEP